MKAAITLITRKMTHNIEQLLCFQFFEIAEYRSDDVNLDEKMLLILRKPLEFIFLQL